MKPLYSDFMTDYEAPWLNGPVLSELEFQVRLQPKQRHGGSGRTKLKTRNYERHVYNEATEQPLIKPADAFGLRVLMLCQKRRGDASNLVKALEDALNRCAYHDDSMIDHLLVTRAVDEPRDLTIVQVRERA